MAAFLLAHNNNRWQTLCFIVTVIYIFLALAIYLVFIQEPKEVGLELEDQAAETKIKESEIEMNSSKDFTEVNLSGGHIHPS